MGKLEKAIKMEVWGCLRPFLAASWHQVGTQKLEPEVRTLSAIRTRALLEAFGLKIAPQGSIFGIFEICTGSTNLHFWRKIKQKL